MKWKMAENAFGTPVASKGFMKSCAILLNLGERSFLPTAPSRVAANIRSFSYHRASLALEGCPSFV